MSQGNRVMKFNEVDMLCKDKGPHLPLSRLRYPYQAQVKVFRVSGPKKEKEFCYNINLFGHLLANKVIPQIMVIDTKLSASYDSKQNWY